MPRIPEAEIERLTNEISGGNLVKSSDIALLLAQKINLDANNCVNPHSRRHKWHRRHPA